MNYLKNTGMATAATLAVMCLVGLASASATTLETGGTPRTGSVFVTATLAAGTSMVLKDEFGTTTDTCTESEMTFFTESPFTGATVSGPVSGLMIGGCTHTTTVIKPGRINITWKSGTNGTVSSSGAEITVQSTFFGASCIAKTGFGTDIGVLTGSWINHATLHVSGPLNMGICGNGQWTGTYTITSPTGLGVVS